MYWNFVLAPSSNHYINCTGLKWLKLAIKPATPEVIEMCGVLACVCTNGNKNSAIFSHCFALGKKENPLTILPCFVLITKGFFLKI